MVAPSPPVAGGAAAAVAVAVTARSQTHGEAGEAGEAGEVGEIESEADAAETEEGEMPAPPAPRPGQFGSVWDSQIGMAGRPGATRADITRKRTTLPTGIPRIPPGGAAPQRRTEGGGGGGGRRWPRDTQRLCLGRGARALRPGRGRRAALSLRPVAATAAASTR